MNKVTIIMILASLGFILIGMFILRSKSINSIMLADEKSNKNSEFIKQNAYMNVLAGIIGIIIASISIFKSEWIKISILMFIIMIFILYILQYILGKKYRN